MVCGTCAPVDVHCHLLSPLRLRQICVEGRDEFAPPLRREKLFERGKRRLVTIGDRDLQPRKKDLAVAARGKPEGSVEIAKPRRWNGIGQRSQEMQPFLSRPPGSLQRSR